MTGNKKGHDYTCVHSKTASNQPKSSSNTDTSIVDNNIESIHAAGKESSHMEQLKMPQRIDTISHQIQQSAESLAGISRQFGSIDSDLERARFLIRLAETGAFNTQLIECDFACISKSSAISDKWRHHGNRHYTAGQYHRAISLYCRAVVAAPSTSESLAVAYANRAAALFQLSSAVTATSLSQTRLLSGCLDDIDRAMNAAYPKHLCTKLWLRRAEALTRLGRFFDAEQSLLHAVKATSGTRITVDSARHILRRVDALMSEAIRERVKLILVTDSATSQKTPSQNSESGSQADQAALKISSPPRLLRASHNQLNSASSCIDVASSEDRGRKLVANCNLIPGDTVIVEDPYCWTLSEACRFSHCQACGVPVLTAVPCVGCCNVIFCSEQCRRQDERHNCRLTQQLRGLRPGQMACLAVEAVLSVGLKKLRQCDNSPADEPGSRHAAAFALVGHSRDRSVGDLFRRSLTALVLAKLVIAVAEETAENSRVGHFLESYADNIQNQDRLVETTAGILHFLQLLSCNAHPITEQHGSISEVDQPSDETNSKRHLEEVGSAVYPTVSLMNHSCAPNVLRISSGVACVVRVIAPLQRGQELLDNYGYHAALHDTQQRQKQLRQQYFFTCQCRPCVEQWPVHTLLPYCQQESSGRREGRCRITTIVEELHQGRQPTQVDVEALTECLTELDTQLKARVSREYNECEEALKHCLLSMGNVNNVGICHAIDEE